jgi:type I restriction enzyme R subunit
MNEADVEAAAFDWLRSLGYALRTGADIDDAGERPNPSAVLLSGRARAALRKVNPSLPDATTDAVVASLSRPPHPTLIENNRWFHGLLAGGVPVEYKDATTGETRGGRAKLIDFENPDEQRLPRRPPTHDPRRQQSEDDPPGPDRCSSMACRWW